MYFGKSLLGLVTLIDHFIIPYSLFKFGIYSNAKLIRQSQTLPP